MDIMDIMDCMEDMVRRVLGTIRISRMIFRRIAFILFCYTCLFSYSQVEKWQVYPAYSEPLQLEAAGNYLYCIMKGSGTIDSKTGNLLRYDVEDGSVETFDCLHALSDKEISHISYNSATESLLVIYATGNVDLIDNDGDVHNITALKDNSIMGESVYGIGHYGKKIYLCTDRGIVELDAYEAIVRETYHLSGNKPFSFAEINEKFYVATNHGLFKFSAMSNMHDKSLWHTPISEEVYVELAVHDSHLFGRKENGVDEISLNGRAFNILQNTVTYMDSDDGCLVFGNSSHVFIYNDEYTSRWNNVNFKLPKSTKDITYIKGKFYVAEGLEGISCYDLQDKQFVNSEPLFHLDSPRRDLFYHITFVGDRLLSAGGVNTQTSSYYPVTFMFMEDGGAAPKWTLFDEEGPKKQYPKLSHYNSVDLVQDPLDDTHFYGAVYRNGLHEYRLGDDGEIDFVRLYNYENSPLQCIDVATSIPWNYCTCTALQYDLNGNLWMANQQTDTIVRIMRPNGKWLSLYYPEIVKSENVLQYLFGYHGINFMVTYEGDKRGFFGFDTSGTLNVTSDDRHLLRNTITNQDGTSVMPTQFYCMAEDKDHQIWCGTNEGLFVITTPQNWFESDFHFHQIKRNRNDGSGFADYLLAGVDVNAITVDPSNSKWIGTLNDGVYLVSHDGQKTIHHFTKENSPLLSNRIYGIAVHPYTGRVMFATDAGLCSYDAQVTEPEITLSEDNIFIYPNPVRPSTNSTVTIEGLTNGTEVKIVSASGKVIWVGKSIGGSVSWNCSDMYGELVASGVYHIICNTDDAKQTVVSRIVVIR